MKHLWKILMIVYMFLFVGIAYASQSPIEEAAPQSIEVGILRSQVELMRHYDQKLLDTVYWSLGVLGTTAVLLTGFGWFANIKIYERDKNVLKQELNAHIGERMEFINNKLTDDNKVFMNEINSTVTSVSIKSAQKVEDDLSVKINSLQKQLQLLQLNMYKAEANKWETQKVYINVLRADIARLKVANAIGFPHFISESLDDILRIVKIIYDSKSTLKPDAQLISEVSNQISKVSDSYSVQISSIIKVLSDIKSG